MGLEAENQGNLKKWAVARWRRGMVSIATGAPCIERDT